MRAVFLSENLKEHLSFLNQALSSKATLPILANFLIETKRGKLSISATDLEIGTAIEIPAQTEGQGKVAVLAKPLSELIGGIISEKITIETKNNQLLIISKNARTTLATTPHDDFPGLYEDKGEEVAVFKKEKIEEDLRSVVFAASQDAGRPVFSGVLMKQERDGVLMVATDAHRLSLRKSQSLKTKKGVFDKKIIVSGRTLRALIGGKKEEDIRVFISSKRNQIIFDQGEALLVGRLLEGEFPDYERIIPGDFSARAEFDKEEMQEAVKMCSIFARETANIMKVSITKDKITVSSKGSLGENTVDVDAKTQGEENEIAFNGRYLLDLLGNVEGERIVFEMTGPLNPGVFKITNDASFLHLIMPIRVKDEELRE